MEEKLRSLRKKMKKAKGFTLIEMVVVIAIIAVLLLLIVPNLSKQKEKASNRTDDAFKTTLQTQVELSDSKNPTWESLLDEGLITTEQKEKAENKHYVINSKGIVENKNAATQK